MDFQELNKKMNDSEYQYNEVFGPKIGLASDQYRVPPGWTSPNRQFDDEISPHITNLEGGAREIDDVSDYLVDLLADSPLFGRLKANVLGTLGMHSRKLRDMASDIRHRAIAKENTMDFQELNKKMNEHQCNEQSPVSMSTQTPPPQVRVYKHVVGGEYDVFASFTTVKEALAYMRKSNPDQMHNWYIIDADGKRLQMNDEGTGLVVTYGLGTTNVPNP